MAKTKIEQGAERAQMIAEAVEAAIGAWMPIAAPLVKGIRILYQRAKARGELTPEEEAMFDTDIAESERLIGEMEVRAADYKARRDADKAAGKK